MVVSENGLETLKQIFARATHDASAAMCRWTGSRIMLTLQEVRELPIEEVCHALELDESPVTAVVLSYGGQLGGQLLVLFDDAHARQLVGAILGQAAPPASSWGELEKSAVTETVNILGCAYTDALALVVDGELMPSALCFVQDYGASVLEQALLAQAPETDRVLLCRTGFQRQGEDLWWHVVFIPNVGLRQALIEAIERHARSGAAKRETFP